MAEQLVTCCSCESWANGVAAQAPFESVDGLIKVAEEVWFDAGEDEILEAFNGHPQIGDLDSLRNKYAATATTEQGQVAKADESVLIALRDGNERYLEKFGFIFIVCATGKTAPAMLALLDSRIVNSREQELENGAGQQMAITRLRIKKLLGDDK